MYLYVFKTLKIPINMINWQENMDDILSKPYLLCHVYQAWFKNKL